MTEIPVIAKVENGRIILFFPGTAANFGRIECWTEREEHAEADMGYYRSLRNPEEGENLRRVMDFYERRYQCAGPFKLKRVRRDSHKLRTERWKR